MLFKDGDEQKHTDGFCIRKCGNQVLGSVATKKTPGYHLWSGGYNTFVFSSYML